MPSGRRPPPGLRASWLAEGALVVMSVPLPDPAPPGLAGLTPAQRAVVALVLDGWPAAKIAKKRKVARSTVYKQLELAYRKLGVRSRAELAALIAGPRGTRGSAARAK